MKAHQKTNVHVHWETQKLQKEEIIKINRLEIENSHLRRLNLILMERICELEKITLKVKMETTFYDFLDEEENVPKPVKSSGCLIC